MSSAAAAAVGDLEGGRGRTCARLKCPRRTDSFIKTFARLQNASKSIMSKDLDDAATVNDEAATAATVGQRRVSPSV